MLNSTVVTPVSSTRSIARPDRIRLARAATGLNPAEKLLLRSLVDFMGNSSECWPSLSRLAAEVCVSPRHIRRMLRTLEAAGWISTEHRFRPDRSQTSCLYRWAKAPDQHVRPPRTSASPLELHIGSIQELKTHASEAECDFEQETEAPVAADVVEVKPADFQPQTAASEDTTADSVTTTIPQSSTPAQHSRKPSPKFIVIDGSKFLDIKEAERVYLAAVAGKLLNSGTADRLAFFACWSAIAAKLRAGKVHHPERMMRFLLDNRKAMSAYPDQAAEQKAREAIRFLFPVKAYNPHC